MARLSSIFFISLLFIIIIIIIHLPSMDARNILRHVSILPDDHEVMSSNLGVHGIISGALPKGISPHSSSGEKGTDHDATMAINYEKLFAHDHDHDAAMMDRILQQSVPSPGAGN